ncbi:beta-galactosidase [Mucilaginibacter sp. SMC90]|uniref:glycoside hydrolase family 2 protein n=1 Tax=Mucilaginibacter sp. SMC90 TaxID=2929803 RepID=UPI001FB4A8EE|nr:sugar-binding domain-containing protein [Mucilaginibacter sp. SMC90]UOE50435.1 beta-galactosidase [Mucilaginibacter sp. SMC90]
MNIKKFIVIAAAALPYFAQAQEWHPKKAVLMTRFARDVDPKNVLPEYPRPQLAREKWLNLNGLWQYQPGTAGEAVPKGKLSKTILVPFPVESALSGVMEQHDRIWYRRKFTVPTSWKGEHILLHFGAVDYESEVFVNGKSFGKHTGGYDPFSYDITSAIKGAGEQEITVRVYDPTDDGGFPRGKQTLHPQGIMYTSTTGIWQTVWLEPVPAVNISDIRITPDIDQSVVKLNVDAATAAGYTVSVKVKDGGKVVSSASGKPNAEFTVPVPNAKLWSPDSPFLYDLDITLEKGGKKVDAVSSYAGMRKISVGEQDGYKKLFLNNKFLFQIGPLDQGFWPDGIYTAPTDAAIKNDLQMIKNFGYNMVRKHIKVEPYRWYYWADKLGLMVWQDMPSANSYTEHTPPVDTAAYASELTRMVKTHWNSPSIVTWVVFNEAQGQHNTPELVSLVRKLDNSRLINQASGGNHFGVGDFLDIHSYPPPAAPSSKTQVLACGEYGGIGYIIPGHVWKTGPTYIMMDNQKAYTNLYDEFANDLVIYKTNEGLSAAVYTETTDVEVELNGLLTYDREIVKGPVATIKASNDKVIHDEEYIREVLPSSKEKARTWKYTFDKPADDWFGEKFDDNAWKSGEAGFGTANTPGAVVKTVWDGKDIWIRQEFMLNVSGVNKDDLVLSLHHDDACEVYINGVKAAVKEGYTSGYAIIQMSKESKDALRLNGKNVIAIHCNQIQGGQYIDAGISAMSKTKP